MASPVRRRRRAPRQLRPTRDGLFYLLLTLVVGFGATNSGNNLLFLVLGLLLATIIVSGLLSEAALRDLAAVSLSSRPAPAGEEARWWISVSKGGGRFPSFALTIEALDGPAVGSKASLFRLAPGTSEEVELRFIGPRRGRFITERIRVSTRFPFGLAEKSRELEVRESLTVYPRRLPATAISEASSARDGLTRSGRAGAGAEPLMLRPWSPGDPLQQMHWRRSAQGRGWVTSVREKESTREVQLEVDLDANADPDALASLERRIEQAAATADTALRQGFLVALRAGPDWVASGTGATHRTRLLEVLAGAQPKVQGRP